MDQPMLLIEHGIYGSGKSTFARQLAEALPATWLRSDKIRAEIKQRSKTLWSQQDEQSVFDNMNSLALAALSKGKSVIYDGTRDVSDFRHQLKTAVSDKVGALQIVVWVQTPLNECIRRAANRQHDADAVHIDEAGVRTYAEWLTDPTKEELCIVIGGTALFDVQFKQFTDQLQLLKFPS